MSSLPNPFGTSRPLQYESRVDSTTLVAFFNTVYAWMASGLALTGVVAYMVSKQPQLMQQIFRGPALLILIIAELALVVAISRAVNKIGPGVATALFMLFAAINGLTLSAIFIVYTQASLASTFIVCAGTFGAMSVYGMITKTDLSKLGAILFMALIGLVIATVVNIFWANSTLYWICTYAGVLIFVGLTAWDTQRLKMIASATAGDPRMASRLAINGALTLYLDFLNLFIYLLRIMGQRRN